MANDFNNSDGGPINVPEYMFLMLFLPKKMLNGEIVGDIYCHNLRQNYAACFSHLTEAIRGCHMGFLKVGAQVGGSRRVTKLTIFGQIQL